MNYPDSFSSMEASDCRILVLGDCGVGKSSLIHYICYGERLDHPRWTIGCTAHVMRYNNRFIEFVDVGGNQKYEESRRVFYHNIDGVMYVYDSSNSRSYKNIKRWQSELRTYGTTLTADGFSQTSIDFSKLPQVVIGNKRDLKTNNAKRVHNPTEEFRVDSFETSAWTGNVDHGRLNLFFDRIFREKTAAIHSNTNSSNVVTRRSKIQ